MHLFDYLALCKRIDKTFVLMSDSLNLLKIHIGATGIEAILWISNTEFKCLCFLL